jgi:hypothetical protein
MRDSGHRPVVDDQQYLNRKRFPRPVSRHCGWQYKDLPQHLYLWQRQRSDDQIYGQRQRSDDQRLVSNKYAAPSRHTIGQKLRQLDLWPDRLVRPAKGNHKLLG